MSGDGDTPFEVRLGRIRSPSGEGQVQRFFKKVGKGARNVSRSRSRGGGGRQRRIAETAFQRRVIVKAHIVRMDGKGADAQRLHLNYVERDGTGPDGEPAKLYNDTELEVGKDAFLERGKEDRHQFRIIISPEDGKELSDLTAYTRDVVAKMEEDLGTKLDWTAANHYDTGQPHTHLIIRGKRDNGEDLVIPRDYISHGIRERAQEIAALELGPVSELEGRNRMARMVSQERLTQIDRDILKRANEDQIDLSGNEARAMKQWRRQLAKMRLKKLEEMGLAEANGKGRWTLHSEMRQTLQRMGERGDIIKTMHRAMEGSDHGRVMDASSIFDPTSENAKPVTGKIIEKGIADDVNDRAYIVVDSTGGKPVYVTIGGEDRLPEFSKGDIVTISPPNLEPRSSDLTIAKIADANNGQYSMMAHMDADKRAKPEFVQAHVRRLEALRRQGHATRHADGSWSIPHDYLDRARSHEKQMAGKRPAVIDRHGDLTLRKMKSAMGSTWLDEHLRDFDDDVHARGFGSEVETARAVRRNYLIKQGIIAKDQHRLTQANLDTLRARDLSDAGEELAARLGKAYLVAPTKGRIEGIYADHIDRASGRFAVIERAKDFSLVPWRDVLERNRGKAVSGLIRADGVSWRLTKGRGISQ